MKILLLLLTTNIVGGGTANSVVSYETIKSEFTRINFESEKINLTTQNMNSVEVDLSYLESHEVVTSEEIKEAVIVELVVANAHFDWINDFLESYLLSNSNSWSTIGINYDLPESGSSVDYKARFLPKYDTKFEGVMAVDITLSNNSSGEIPSEDKNLSEVILNTNLGWIMDNKSETIKNNVLLQNKSLDGSEFYVDINSITNSGAKLVAIENSGYFGFVSVKFKDLGERTNISQVITTTDLGEISDNSKSTIVNKVVLKNKDITINDFNVEDITNNSARIVASDSSIYYGTVDVEFTIKVTNPDPNPENDLSKMIGSLGNIDNIKTITILERFAEVNSDFKIDTNDLKLENITYSKAKLVPKNDNFIGSLELTYRVESQVVNDVKFSTRETNAEAYNSTKTDSDNFTIEYDIKTDINDFKNHFTKLRISYSGYMYNQKQNGWNNTDWKDGTEDVIDIDWNNLQNGTAWKHQEYIGKQNSNWNDIKLTIELSGSKLTFKFEVISKAKATWINAYYSRAKAQLSVSKLEFISDKTKEI
ncbi:hypothetical protein STIUS_v1c02880 [Spiroplasma sp. TIUS-1]|uniref:hypothetical protein n=1 Tax=Spiroplasma sp. TIUS-1 TaxID=216963 RepID=UPI0013987C4C|nr:hypothetical protein [Spiroplasma sp. TIUS-1]QHX35842.1 hypothetical protein STIUS_v1c02880 [Spiroplasma sp. TIUS-1]